MAVFIYRVNQLCNQMVVFVAFCADWCPFSRRLKPIFEESARVFKQENPDASVVWAIVDSVRQADVGDKYYVNKYPTMKVFVNGELIQKEYRSTRSVEALTNFVKYQLSTAINEFSNEEQLNSTIDRSKRNIVALVKRGDEVYANVKKSIGAFFSLTSSSKWIIKSRSTLYRRIWWIALRKTVTGKPFQKIASLLREDCTFWVLAEAPSATLNEERLSFIDPDTQQEQHFSGDFRDYEFLKQWVTDKCIPLVREVTFENVEELTEEGLPFLLYFRDPKKKDEDKIFTEQVVRELYDQRAAVNPLLADGYKFAHPLKHLGKTMKFVLDLHSGKLHKDFHETLDQKMIDLAKFKEENGIVDDDLEDNRETDQRLPSTRPGDTTPPPSVFKQLKPSEKRYSLLQKTEL
ncbi:unnamed protein product [Angiostrongylus costaricensis]|uniref:Thioredoxin domain-containing protein n=1 Tax=Angiostrongylus costaricensis TaxID=334426 RepID=A0A158PIS9_ANGCS|nr:unnamed protein product [Angiostrongylus costaricensis]